MRKKFLAGIIGITLLLLVGCGAKENEQVGNMQEENLQEENVQQGNAQQENAEQENIESENMVTEGELQEDTTGELPEVVDEQISLSKSDLQEWSNYVNTWVNNGFLLSYYDTADEVDLNELFYSGCGLEQEPLSEAEIEAYLKLTDAEEIYTECIKLTTSQIEGVLQKRLGLSMDKMRKPLGWVYLEEMDCYVSEHGDTNAARYTCTSGYQQGNLVVLNCAAMDGDRDCRVTLQKAEDNNWQFISNEKIENTEDVKAIWQIEEQSFEIELNNWGNVTFVSYAPEASIGVFYPPSVSFELFQNGESIYQFPEVFGEELLDLGSTFKEIKAIAFRDIDGNGYKDVIAIIGYEEGDAVRIYSGNADDFYYMEGLSAYINGEGANKTIQEVMEFLGE